MDNPNGSNWSIQNLRGTPLVIIGILVAALLGIFGINVAFRGHVQL